MSHCLAELYTPKPAWLALDPDARSHFFAGIASGMAPLLAMGVEPMAMAETDAGTPHAAGQQFFAIWRAPDEGAMRALISGIAASGWHEYFETINATGVATGLEEHLAQLAGLPHRLK